MDQDKKKVMQRSDNEQTSAWWSNTPCKTKIRK